jgi:hypothetical protein
MFVFQSSSCTMTEYVQVRHLNSHDHKIFEQKHLIDGAILNEKYPQLFKLLFSFADSLVMINENKDEEYEWQHQVVARLFDGFNFMDAFDFGTKEDVQFFVDIMQELKQDVQMNMFSFDQRVGRYKIELGGLNTIKWLNISSSDVTYPVTIVKEFVHVFKESMIIAANDVHSTHSFQL